MYKRSPVYILTIEVILDSTTYYHSSWYTLTLTYQVVSSAKRDSTESQYGLCIVCACMVHISLQVFIVISVEKSLSTKTQKEEEGLWVLLLS